MLLARLYILVALCLLATWLRTSVATWQAGVRAWQELRLAVLAEPLTAIATHCQQSPGLEPLAVGPQLQCRTELAWRRGRPSLSRNGLEEICASLAAGHGGLGLAAPRYYRIGLRCQWHLGGHRLQLALLPATVFR